MSSQWEMILLIVENLFSTIPVIENFLRPISAHGTASAPLGWPQLTRAVTDKCREI